MSTSRTLKTATDQTSAQYLADSVVQAYLSLTSGDHSLIKPLYTDDVYFEDPSHGIQGKASLMKYFANISRNMDQCTFKFHRTLTTDTEVFLTWTMIFSHQRLAGGETIRVEGSSFLKTRNGKIYYHRNYFDMGSMVYENLPIVGRIIKKIRLRLGQ
ncbi:MAG: nuclear transport factor 2 family protein [Pseudohongiellaceae bacterium]